MHDAGLEWYNFGHHDAPHRSYCRRRDRQEVIPAGIAVLEARHARHENRARVHRSAVGVRVLPETRADVGGGRLRSPLEVRCDLPWRDRRAWRGRPRVGLGDLLLPLRQQFDQYVNLRPMRLLPGLVSPLANRRAGGHRHGLRPGEYRGRVCRAGRPNPRGDAARGRGADGRVHAPWDRASRALRIRGGVASDPRRLLASATKSNALRHSMVLWDEVAENGARATIRRCSTGSTTWTPRRTDGHGTRRRST